VRALLVTALAGAVAAALATGCSATPAPQPRPAPYPQEQVSSAASGPLSKPQACQHLLDDVTRHQGVPSIPTLRRIADHVTEPRMAADARTAVKDIGHTGVAPIPLALLRDDCRRAGVPIPPP
jgi:hypothetical protein